MEYQPSSFESPAGTRADGRRRACWVALVLCAPLPLAGQQSATVTGLILHGGQNRRPLAGHWTVLHEVREGTVAVVDSARTGATGRYQLTLPQADTAALYLVSTTYQEVGYFSEPVRAEAANGTEAKPLVVYDTTSAGPAMRLEKRLLTLLRRGDQEGRNALEIVEISNPGDQTRISPDSLSPVWSMALPPGVSRWEVGEGDITLEAIWLEDDTVKVFAPIWPGAPRHTSYRYALHVPTVRVALDQWTGEFSLLIEDTTAVVSGASVAFLGIHELEGRRLAAYRTGPLEAGAELRVTLSRAQLNAEQLVPYIVGAGALALAWGLWVALKRKPPRAI